MNLRVGGDEGGSRQGFDGLGLPLQATTCSRRQKITRGDIWNL